MAILMNYSTHSLRPIKLTYLPALAKVHDKAHSSMSMIPSLAHALRLQTEAPVSRLERLMLLEMLLGKPREYLLAHDDDLLSEKQIDAFTMLLGLRSQGHPMAYLVGKREFFGLSFAVNQEVLIPRPETEWLVHAAIRLLPRHGAAIDLGTGSGAIAIALAHHRPDVRLMACDINPKALELASRNAQHLLGPDQQIRFQRSDWWEAVPLESLSLVLSNPPYLSMDDPHLMQGDLRFEPRLALSDEADGLGAIQKITEGFVHRAAMGLIEDPGLLLIEHGYQQAEAIRSLG
ncbi:MAG: peptide chain release factor N(5)-glutamine methyltransferase, partial [Betaproteobacteria bacterium]|nr:peptide chain release factor N(5)-glutamine methyltransferase [Betaproteobacteria bacterium]